MPSFRCSSVNVAVLTALSLSSISPVFAAQTSAETDKKSTDSVQEVITVQGSQVDIGGVYQGGQVARTGRAGLLGNMDMMDTPFSSTNYTADLIRDQQAKSVADVMLNDPTVRVARGFGNFQELYMIRGFNVYSDDMTLNGVYGILPRQFVAAQMMERVEVFRGANTFLNAAAPGGSAVGGLINIVPKRAGSEPLTRVTAGIQSGGQAYSSLDWSRRYGDAAQDGLRVGLTLRDGDDGVDDQNTQLGSLTVGWDHQGDQWRLSADLGYQDHHIDQPRPSVTPLTSAPSLPNANDNYAQNWTYTDEKQLFGVVRGEYDFTDATTAWLAVGGRHGSEHNLSANPTADSQGNLTAYKFENKREDNILSSDAGVRHRFVTGPVTHTAVLSGSVFYSRSKNATEYSNWGAPESLGSLRDYQQITQPPTDAAISASYGDLDEPSLTQRNLNLGLSAADTLAMLDDAVKVTVGARLQRIDQKSYSYTSSYMTSSYAQNAVTPFMGVVYQPTLDWSLYANYAEALQPGKVAPQSNSGAAVTNAGEVFSPLRSQQYEVGAKYDNGAYGGAISLFQINKNTYLYDEQNRFNDNGEQRNRGIELTGFGQVFEQLNILGGVTFIDGELHKTQNSVNDGHTAIGVPDVTAKLNLEWLVPAVPGLSVNGRAIYTSSQYIDMANEHQLPSWTRFDMGVRYTMQVNNQPLTLNARVENIADKDYWASTGGYPGSNYLVQGAPRTFMLSASYDF